jgi:hypothetical protein
MFRRIVVLGLALVPTSCSDLALSEEMPPSGPDPAYNDLVATHIKASFKDYAAYQAYELSGYRWVHSLHGWAWITCVRFQDQGHPRTYAVFIKDGKVVDSRYAVQIDACTDQAYGPFTAIGAMRHGVLGPLY